MSAALIEAAAKAVHNAGASSIRDMGGLMPNWEQLSEEDRENSRADARFVLDNSGALALIAELFEALSLMVSNFAGLLNDADHDKVHAALAKARGDA